MLCVLLCTSGVVQAYLSLTSRVKNSRVCEYISSQISVLALMDGEELAARGESSLHCHSSCKCLNNNKKIICKQRHLNVMSFKLQSTRLQLTYIANS